MDKNNLKKNQIVSGKIDGINSLGNGIIKNPEMPVIFVPSTAIGDEVTVEISKVSKNFATASLLEITSPSKGRIPIDCEFFSECGGCSFRHISYEDELQIKQDFVEDSLSRIGKISFPVSKIIPSSKTDSYRNKAIFHVHNSDGEISFGFMKKNSNEIVSINKCYLLPDEFTKIAGFVCDFAMENEITAYNRLTNFGSLRQIYLRKTDDGIMLCLVINEEFHHIAEFITEIKSKFSQIKQIAINVNKEKKHNNLSRRTSTIFGEGLEDNFLNLKFSISPNSFYQVNKDMAQVLYENAILALAPNKNDILLDLYSGIGSVGLAAAGSVSKVIGIEIVLEAIKNAETNAEQNGISNAKFINADVKKGILQVINQGILPDLVIFDPPRSGADKAVLEGIIKLAPKKIVMISCDHATAARDAKILIDAGFKLKTVQPVDMFPRTYHVENIFLFHKL